MQPARSGGGSGRQWPCIVKSLTAPAAEAEATGTALARRLLQTGAKDVVSQIIRCWGAITITAPAFSLSVTLVTSQKRFFVLFMAKIHPLPAARLHTSLDLCVYRGQQAKLYRAARAMAAKPIKTVAAPRCRSFRAGNAH